MRLTGSGSGVRRQYAGRAASGQLLTERHGAPWSTGSKESASLPVRRGPGPGGARRETQVSNFILQSAKNIHLQEKNLLSLSYGRIVRKNIDTKEGLLPESFDGYNIVEDGDIVIRGTDLQNDHRSLRTGLVTERGIITSAYMTLRSKENVNSTYYDVRVETLG